MSKNIGNLPKDCLILILKNVPADFKNTAPTCKLWYRASLEAKLALQEEKLVKATSISKCFLLFDIARLNFKIFKTSSSEESLEGFISLTTKCNALFQLHNDVLEQIELSSKALQRALSVVV